MAEHIEQLEGEVHAGHKANYAIIFGILAALTIIEVTVAAGFPLILLALSVVKIVLVAGYFMHLRFASRYFSAIFLIPIPFVAMIVVAIVVALSPNPDSTSAAAATVCTFF